MGDTHNKLSRRELLRLAAFGAAGAFLSACQGAVVPLTSASPEGGPAPEPTKELFATGSSPAQAPVVQGQVAITPIQDFYTVAYRDDEPPQIPADWKLTITGQVNQPMSLSLDEIKALPSVAEMRTLACISNPVGGDLISNANWKGVRLKDLLTQAGVKGGVTYLKLESFDGYSTGIPIELAMDDHSLLVYEMNEVPLPAIHGAPLRCLWPGRYGMKQPKWIQTITAISSIYMGFWEQQGWSNEAIIQPFSRIDSPGDLAQITATTFTVSGIAYSSTDGLKKLEIGWDDTGEWQPAELTRGPSPLTWGAWTWTGPALASGRHTLYARATDNGGRMQTFGQTFNMLGGTFPNGTTDMHSVVIDFKA